MKDSERTNEFLKLLMANYKRVYAFILSMVPNYQDAQDLLQETILVMWSKYDTFEPGTNFGAWATQIARYHILNARRRDKQAYQFSTSVQSRLEDRTETFVQHIDHRMHALRHCVGKLAKPDYELIKLRYEQEVPVSEIAQQRGRTTQSIYKRMVLLHTRLMRCVQRAMAREGIA